MQSYASVVDSASSATEGGSSVALGSDESDSQAPSSDGLPSSTLPSYTSAAHTDSDSGCHAIMTTPSGKTEAKGDEALGSATGSEIKGASSPPTPCSSKDHAAARGSAAPSRSKESGEERGGDRPSAQALRLPRKSLPLIPRMTQYERHPLLQAQHGVSELEALLKVLTIPCSFTKYHLTILIIL